MVTKYYLEMILSDMFLENVKMSFNVKWTTAVFLYPHENQCKIF